MLIPLYATIPLCRGVEHWQLMVAQSRSSSRIELFRSLSWVLSVNFFLSLSICICKACMQWIHHKNIMRILTGPPIGCRSVSHCNFNAHAENFYRQNRDRSAWMPKGTVLCLCRLLCSNLVTALNSSWVETGLHQYLALRSLPSNLFSLGNFPLCGLLSPCNTFLVIRICS